ncbi:phospholipase D-like domain-containing protein [Polyangium fumosum]|uniref:phospholipase D n=1 Tax=Polyangium fumosum TaxID=889272 RepID=A0A4U1IUJ5_9BACT|nr:phosphatidylserine/phosphatidylglycerophosphate/cardiolipin synthase family protein [Polyangium fumosum]TKC98026.1 phosphatidylserine/phosphatidylglycerophosphate/cardiolipin synthase family protein [Polyangium fumosum]
MTSAVPGETWIEDRTGDVLEGAWTPTNAQEVARTPMEGRILQAEERGELGRLLSALIGAAQGVVLLSSFLFADPGTERALLEAARRGVRVYMLVASEARLEKESRDDGSFDQKALEDHKRLLNALAGWVYVRSAEHFHAKFVLVDPNTDPRGVLLTANLAEKPLTRNHELAVNLRPAEVRAIAALFTWSFWESAQRELLAAGSLPPVRAAGRFSVPTLASGIVATAGERRDLRSAALQLIRSAHRTLVIAIYGIGDLEVIEALEERARSGVSVVLLVRHPRVGMHGTLQRLARARVTVLGVSPWLHAKAILADGMRGLLMTANLEAHGLDDGFEVGVELSGDDAAALARVLGAWHSGAQWQLRASARVGELRGVVQVLNGKGYKEVTVEPATRVDDGHMKVDCCTKIEGAAPPKPRRPPEGRLYHKIEHLWAIEPPSLARGAKPWAPPKRKDVDAPAPPFPIFEESPGGRRVFAIDTLAQLEAARTAMQPFGVNAVVLRG